MDWDIIADHQILAPIIPAIEKGPVCPPIQDAVKLEAIRAHKIAEIPTIDKQRCFVEYVHPSFVVHAFL